MSKKNLIENMVEYQGRLVSRDHFAAFIYKADGAKKLVHSWSEYQAAVSAGEWLSELPKPEFKKPEAKAKAE